MFGRLAKFAISGFGLLITLALIGCSGSTRGLKLYRSKASLPPSDPDYKTKLQVKYLGCGGVILRRGDDVIMTAPFYSNPSVLQASFFPISCRTSVVDRLLPDVTDVKEILVGHSHYDHRYQPRHNGNHLRERDDDQSVLTMRFKSGRRIGF